jgi:hypothetical protein
LLGETKQGKRLLVCGAVRSSLTPATLRHHFIACLFISSRLIKSLPDQKLSLM